MAETGENQGNDYKAHAETFSGFTALMTWGTIGSFAIGAFVVFLIAQ
ncbi:MAG: aa3-type cytochrome c oxidase subunit IV [Sphingomonas sp.]